MSNRASLLDKLAPEARKVLKEQNLDDDKLQQLLELEPLEQGHTLRKFKMGLEWEKALPLPEDQPTEEEPPTEKESTAADEHHAPEAALAEAHEADPEPRGERLVQRWRVDALRPNTRNGTLFTQSLSEARIADLAADLQRNRQRTPIEILADGTILDGESRWRAAQHLGWEMVDVAVVADTMTDREILQYIVDASTSQRIMSVREQVAVFEALLELSRTSDPRNEDQPGSKETDLQNEDRRDPKAARDEAARRVGFRSYETARRARRVFREASEDVQRKLDASEISVNAAYQTLEPARASSAPQKRRASEPDHPSSESPSMGLVRETTASGKPLGPERASDEE